LRLPQSIRFPGRTRRRSPGVSPAVFLAHLPDLQHWPLMDMDFATSCPLVRPSLPRIRLLFVRSRFRSTLPSDGPSRLRPCASLVLHLHQVAQGTFTPRLLDMPSTQDASRRDAVASPKARPSLTAPPRGARPRGRSAPGNGPDSPTRKRPSETPLLRQTKRERAAT
jgi:hypothetical protein